MSVRVEVTGQLQRIDELDALVGQAEVREIGNVLFSQTRVCETVGTYFVGLSVVGKLCRLSPPDKPFAFDKHVHIVEERRPGQRKSYC